MNGWLVVVTEDIWDTIGMCINKWPGLNNLQYFGKTCFKMVPFIIL